MWIAVPTSCSVPASIECSALSDSRTPPAQDWISVFMSFRKPFRSVARCALDGCTAIPTSTPATTMAAPAANHQRGVLRTGQAPRRIGTYGGSARGGLCMGAPPLLAGRGHQAGAGGQLRLCDRPVDAFHDDVARVEEEGGRQPGQVVGD